MSTFVRNLKKRWRLLFFVAFISMSAYGAGRYYFHLTDGFSVGNILSDIPFDPEWNTRKLSERENELVHSVLNQEFHYLGKGCQSYVFVSNDGDYVLKFFKYQRFRPKPWDDTLSFLPGMAEYRKKKQQKKQRKLDKLFQSCRIAFDNLQEETGLIYVHLNKTNEFKRNITIHDKLGFKHELDIDKMEFMIQKRAQMICPAVNALMSERKVKQANRLIQNFINMVLTEYGRGLADNDHALMQNTGICQDKPIHVDVGQFVWHSTIGDTSVYKQELFNKTYKFRLWLEKTHPELLKNLNERLISIIGEDFYSMEPTHLIGR